MFKYQPLTALEQDFRNLVHRKDTPNNSIQFINPYYSNYYDHFNVNRGSAFTKQLSLIYLFIIKRLRA